MKLGNNINKFAAKFPKITLAGYLLMKKVWRFKANYTDYDYPEHAETSTIEYSQVLEYNKERDFGPKKRICYAPFNNLHFKIDGEVAACSFNRETLIGNINGESIHDLWFGESAKRLRENIGNYNLQNCYGCKTVLKSGNYRSFPANKYDYHSSDDSIYPTQMSFETSNLCNLECVMCDEELSSSIRKNKAKLPALKDVYPADFTEQLKEFIPHLSITTFIGGEPLLIKRYYQIWEEIIQTNPGCKIHLQTNATYLPQKFLQLLESGQFDVGISMEGCTKVTYEKIRLKGKFDVVEENIKKLVTLKEKGLVYLNINFCPLTLNWEEVPLMVNYANGLRVPLKLLNVETPRNLALKNQPAAVLQKIHDYLLHFKFEETAEDFISARNRETYLFFIKTIRSYITEAEKRDLYLEQHADTALTALKNTLEADFISSNVFSYLTHEQKTDYSARMYEFVCSKSADEQLIRNTLNRLIYFFKEIMHEEDTFKDIHQSFHKLKKIAEEFYELEQTEMNTYHPAALF